MPGGECFDACSGLHEVPREIGVRRIADHDEQRDTMPLHRGQLIWLVADSAVVRDCQPAALTGNRQPLFVRRRRAEVVRVRFNI
jgi:hypothetical protein